MRKINQPHFIYILIITVIITFTSCSDDTNKAPKYSGKASGYGGEVSVTITLTENKKIGTLLIDASSESQEVGQVAARRVAKTIIAKQSLAIDAVSGATMSSKAVLQATEQALKEAGIDVNSYKN